MTTKSRTTSRRISKSRQKRKESLRQRRRQQRLEEKKSRERRKKFSRNKKKTRRKPSPKILEDAKPSYFKTLRDIITRKTMRSVTLV
jgi:hypothetical protein